MDNTMENEFNKKLMELIEPELKRITEEMCQMAIEKYGHENSKNDPPSNCRRIVVTYNPDNDVDDLDYVNVEVTPQDDAQGANDNIALLLAAAKRLANTCPYTDESVYGQDLLDLTNDYMFGLVMKKLLGG